jgi:hypothetical protein
VDKHDLGFPMEHKSSLMKMEHVELQSKENFHMEHNSLLMKMLFGLQFRPSWEIHYVSFLCKNVVLLATW